MSNTPLPSEQTTSILPQGKQRLSPEQLEIIRLTVGEIINPVFEAFAKILKNNTAALDQIASAQQVQADRLEALEKQVRLNTPVTGTQATYINNAIRERSRVLLSKYGLENDKRAVTRLGNMIRKSVLTRYGVGGIRDIPRHEYSVALSQIAIWNQILQIKDIAEEAKNREKNASEFT